jgi:hypothetical protein
MAILGIGSTEFKHRDDLYLDKEVDLINDAIFDSDNISLYTDSYAKLFPGIRTPQKFLHKKINYCGYPPIYIKEELTNKDKNNYTKILNRWAKNFIYKKFLINGLSFYINKCMPFTTSKPSHLPDYYSVKQLNPQKTLFQKIKLWIGYKLYCYHHKYSKDIFNIGVDPKVIKAIKFALQGQISLSNKLSKKMSNIPLRFESIAANSSNDPRAELKLEEFSLFTPSSVYYDRLRDLGISQ